MLLYDVRRHPNCGGRDPRDQAVDMQAVMAAIAGYFGGYICKKQKVGQFELKKSIDALPLLKEKLASRTLNAGHQLAHVCNRFFSVLESKGILRTGTEEFLLASRYRPDDPLNAEFVRTFRHRFFLGFVWALLGFLRFSKYFVVGFP